MPVNDTVAPTEPEQAPTKAARAFKRAGASQGTPKPVKRASRAGKAATGQTTAKRAPRSTAKLDAYGFRVGSLKSQAVALYTSRRGATIPEVEAKIGSRQFNVIKELEEQGFKVERSQESGAGKRPVTRFRIMK